MAEDTSVANKKISCPECGLKFKARGIKIHKSRCHSQHSSVLQQDGATLGTQVPLSSAVPRTPTDVEDLGKELALLKSTIPTLKRVPKGARLAAAQALSTAINKVVDTNEESAWKDLFTFPFAVLEVPKQDDKVKNLTKWVKDKVDKWLNNPFEPRHRAGPNTFGKRKLDNENALRYKIEGKLADGDVKGAIRLAVSDDKIAPSTAETFLALQSKHPGHDSPMRLLPAQDPHPCPRVSETEVLAAIASFYPGSAGGLDGLKPQILKDLTNKSLGQTATQLLLSIQGLMDLLLSGGVPSSISPLLFGATLTALQKKEGGIRPVAVGMSWRRLCSKIVVKRIMPTVTNLTSPNQLGVGIKGGAEAGVHASRLYWNHPHSSPKLFIKLDYKNAFNELRRDSMLNAVQTFIPAYYSYIDSCYTNPSFLFFGQEPILSQRGLQQGDPLGPALFSLTMQPVVSLIKTELNIWYLDDATIADSVETTLDALTMVREMSKDIGLSLNERKCEMSVLGADENTAKDIISKVHEIAPDIHLMESAESVLLGAPLSDSAIDSAIEKKITSLSTMSSRLNLLSSHSAFFLLRASISIPRLIYCLRCAPTWKSLDPLQRFDAELRRGLETILNCSFNEDSWRQSSLPVKSGGLGLRHATDVALPCFLASFHSIQHLLVQILPPHIHTDPALEDGVKLWQSTYGIEIPADPYKSKQAAWEEPQIKETLTSLSTSASTSADRARILAVQQPDAGSWLMALPSPQLGTLLTDEVFRVSCALRLGCGVCQPHKCPCGGMVCDKGYHGLSCKFSSGRRSRHECVNEVISRALRSANIPNIREPAGCSRSDGKKPDGLTLVPWSHGKSVVWDFTCVDTTAPTYLSDTVRSPGAAAERAETRKILKYNFLAERYNFIPVAIESLGVWGSRGRNFIQDIGFRLVEVTGDKRAPSFLKQRVSLAIQRGNAASILGTLPTGKKLEEIFYL